MKFPTWTVAIAIAALGAVFIAVDLGVKSHAVERTATKTTVGAAPAASAPLPIAGADADVNSVNW
jgi:hypothetical protein